MAWAVTEPSIVWGAFRDALYTNLNSVKSVHASQVYISLDPHHQPDSPHAGHIVYVVTPQAKVFNAGEFIGGGNDSIGIDQIIVVTLWSFHDLEQLNRSSIFAGTGDDYGIDEHVKEVLVGLSGQMLSSGGNEILNEPIRPQEASLQEMGRNRRNAQIGFHVSYDWDVS